MASESRKKNFEVYFFPDLVLFFENCPPQSSGEDIDDLVSLKFK